MPSKCCRVLSICSAEITIEKTCFEMPGGLFDDTQSATRLLGQTHGCSYIIIIFFMLYMPYVKMLSMSNCPTLSLIKLLFPKSTDIWNQAQLFQESP